MAHILQAKFQRPVEEIEGLGMKNHCKEKRLRGWSRMPIL
jgi:hypothetical protein